MSISVYGVGMSGPVGLTESLKYVLSAIHPTGISRGGRV